MDEDAHGTAPHNRSLDDGGTAPGKEREIVLHSVGEFVRWVGRLTVLSILARLEDRLHIDIAEN